MAKNFIEWSDALSVNFHEIDYEHKNLVELVNRLAAHAKEKDKVKVLHETYNELIKYTQYHFKHEEELMEKYNYPEKTLHSEQHRSLEKEVLLQKKTMDEDLSQSPVMMILSTLDFLKSWLSNHICQTDKKLGEFLINKTKCV